MATDLNVLLSSDEEMQVDGFAVKMRQRAVRGVVVGLAVGLASIGAFIGYMHSSWAARAWASGVVEKAAFAGEENCLCLFDVDRTLTGKQQWSEKCTHNLQVSQATDYSFSQGPLLLSEACLNLDQTFCKACYRGIVTAGQAGGEDSPERKELLRRLGGTEHTRTNWWQDAGFDTEAEIKSSLVVQAKDGSKHVFAQNMLKWWNEVQHVDIKPENVHFFDDVLKNVKSWAGTGMNARQISCGTRGVAEWGDTYPAGLLGGCGATISELVPDKGVHFCSEQ